MATDMAPRNRLLDLDRAKGLAITLVVVGHIKDDVYPAGNEWYRYLCDLIYSFHMPFFLFVTGFLMFYSYPRMASWEDYRRYAARRFFRLMPAYVLFAALIALGKMTVGLVAPMERPIGGLGGFLAVFLTPTNSYCRSLWYIYVVFIYSITVPILLRLVKDDLRILVGIGLALHFVPRTNLFAMGQASEYALTFLLGGYAAQRRAVYERLVDSYPLVWWGIFLGLLLGRMYIGVPKVLVGLSSVPALHALVRFKFWDRDKILATFGVYVFPIYLMNKIAIGIPKVLILKYWSWDGDRFFFIFPVLVMAGLVIPVLIQRHVISRVPVLRDIVR